MLFVPRKHVQLSEELDTYNLLQEVVFANKGSFVTKWALDLLVVR
jgi:hypothetical protein